MTIVVLEILKLKICFPRGSTDTANMSKKFNSFEKRDHVIELYKLPEPEKASLKKIIQALSCILRVLNSWRQKIDVEKFGQYLLDTHIKLHDQFEWLDDNSQFSCSIGFS